MKHKLILLLTVAATAMGAPEGSMLKAFAPPNIVYILADDLGYGDVACYNVQSKLPTPRIDRLATEGMRFTDVHSASACTPTRYGILTGRYAFRSRVPWAVLDSYDPPLIEAGRLTVPALLQRQGYRTACIGKWHLGWDWPKGNQPDGEPDFTQPIANGPITRGFDEYFGTHVPNQPPFAFIENDRLTEQPTARFPGKDAEQFVFKSGPMVPGWKFENIMPTLAARVENYLRARAEDRKRFFLYYTLTIPHEPLAPTAEFMGKSGINRVGDLILQTDAAVGAVLDALKKLGLEENTLVIFASDNGHGPGTGVPALLAAGHDPSRPYRGYKGSLLEGGHRIPFIVRWPGKVKAGVVCDELISLVSLMATCAELTGAKIPADAGEDSHSILPLLLDWPGAYSTHETLVHAGGNGFAVRQGPWKLVHAKAISPERQKMYPEATSGLFNVERDPAEKNDLLAQHPDIASRLEEQLTKIRRGGGPGSEVTPSTKAGVSVSDPSNATDDENARMPAAPKPAAAKSSDPAGAGMEKADRYPSMSQAMDSTIQLQQGFAHPPDSARPWVYLFPLDGNLSREGITADLEAMKRVGIGGVIFMETDQGAPQGPARFGGPLWREMFQHLCTEAHRLGLQVNMNNAAGWTGSGGPWITPEMSMQKVVWSETVVDGPRRFEAALPRGQALRDYYRDIAVFAFPTPAGEDVTMADRAPRITASVMNKAFDAKNLLDDDTATTVTLPRPEPGKPHWIDVEFPQPFMARTLKLNPGWQGRLVCHGALQVSSDGREFRTVRDFELINLPLSLAFEETTARYFRILFTRADAPLRQLLIAGVELSPRFCIDNIEGKSALATIEFTPQAAYAALPVARSISRERTVNLTAQLGKDGRLAWDVPPGKWTLLRFGHTTTGRDNHPAPLEGRGLECDKLSKEAAEVAFNGLMAKLIADSRPLVGENRTLVSTHIDSWEVGSQNWTPKFREEFQRLRGYDPLPFLPAMTGRVVDSLEVSERFLRDLRQTVSDLVVENYAGHFRTLAHRHGIRLSIEAYDGSPTDDLTYAGAADELMTEFWAYPPPTGTPWREWVTEMASAAHVWGTPILASEAFTATQEEKWQAHPFTVKSLGDWAFCEGVNRLVFHRYALQPWTNPDRPPGMSMGPWGLHYERTQTWWEQSKAWHEYLARCQYLLQRGLFVADICYLAAERSPQRWRVPGGATERPGYNFDGCPPDVVLTRMTVKDGKLILPDDMSYRVLVLPEVATMTPRLLRRIGELVEAGATVIGPRPVKSPSLTDYPQCDAEVKALADRLWGDCDGRSVQEHRFGKGRVVQGQSPKAVLAGMGVKPDFAFTSHAPETELRYVHRAIGDAEIYFVANKRSQAAEAVGAFRAPGRRPELWWPDTGRFERVALYDEADGVVRLPLRLDPAGSVFVVFRADAPSEANRITSVVRLDDQAAGSAAVELTRNEKGRLDVRVSHAGNYELRSADGKRRQIEVSSVPAPLDVAGSWELRFPPNWGAPAQVTLAALAPWNEHADAGVRHFSGTATYSKTFSVSTSQLAKDVRWNLDLGKVAIMAEVTLNGKNLGILWKPPFRVDVTDALQAGDNALEVRVVNLWINRMIGDEQLPADSQRKPNGTLVAWPQWLNEGKPSPSGRFTFSSWPLWKKDDPLVESGLCGPVKLQAVRQLVFNE